jgi:hypothetical protein
MVLTLAPHTADAPGVSVNDTTVDTTAVAAGAIRLPSPLTSDRPLSFPRPLVVRLFIDRESPPTHLEPALAGSNTDFPWASTNAIARRLSCAPETQCRLVEIRPPIHNVRSRLGNTVFAETAPTPTPMRTRRRIKSASFGPKVESTRCSETVSGRPLPKR